MNVLSILLLGQRLTRMTDRILRNLQERKAIAEQEVKGYQGAVWKGERLGSGVRPHAGLVAGIAPELQTVAARPRVGYKFFTSIRGHTAELRFWIYPNHPHSLADLRRNARLAFVWLEMLLACVSGADGSRGMICDFLMLPDQRVFPDKVDDLIAPIHCNGGLSYIGEEFARFCVYRHEEWFKVFVHETFHAFGVHGRFPGWRVVKELTGLSFPEKLELSEVYAETWARIALALFARGGKGVSELVRRLDREAEHGWRQCQRALPHVAVGVKAGRGQLTPALEYYCLTGVVMTKWRVFLEWCFQHNWDCEGGVGFELRDPEMWLEWLGGVVNSGLVYHREIKGAALPTEGRSARMSHHEPMVPRN